MSEQTVKLTCTHCNKVFERTLRNHYTSKKLNCQPFCSKKCHSQYQKSPTTIICAQCSQITDRLPNQIKKSKSGNNFCSRSCAVTYNNQHKTTGTKRSKLENYLEAQLTILYPNLQILYNNKQIINSELDIYIPSLKIGF